jgi:hypothetical protein
MGISILLAKTYYSACTQYNVHMSIGQGKKTYPTLIQPTMYIRLPLPLLEPPLNTSLRSGGEIRRMPLLRTVVCAAPCWVTTGIFCLRDLK